MTAAGLCSYPIPKFRRELILILTTAKATQSERFAWRTLAGSGPSIAERRGWRRPFLVVELHPLALASSHDKSSWTQVRPTVPPLPHASYQFPRDYHGVLLSRQAPLCSKTATPARTKHVPTRTSLPAPIPFNTVKLVAQVYKCVLQHTVLAHVPEPVASSHPRSPLRKPAG